MGGFLAGPAAGGAAGGPVVAVAVTVVTALAQLFGSIFGGGGDANAAIQQLRNQTVTIGNTLLQFAAQIARTVGAVIKYLGGLIFSFLRPLLKLLGKILEKLAEIYQKYLEPIIKTIQRIRARIIKIYERILRPILLVFQRVHQILTILKLFHLKFAAKLDAELMRLEAKLTAPLYQVLRYINILANTLNLVMDSRLVLRRAVTLNALNDTKGSWTRMWWNAQTIPMSDDDLRALTAQNASIEPGQAASAFEQYATQGTGPLQQLVDDGVALFQSQLGV